MILVFGGAGYIGSHMARLLREAGEPHLVADNFEDGHHRAVEGSPFIHADLQDPASLAAIFTDHPEITSVINFAAYISVGESVREPLKYWKNNVGGMMNLLAAMKVAGVNRLVFSSTAAVYGEPIQERIDEDHPKHPTSCYGQTKLAVEHLLADADRGYGLKSVCLRYFNASGAHPSGEIGEAHRVEEHLIPLAISAVMGTRPPLKVFGTDWNTPDGTCVRDYVHVVDLAEAHAMAVKHLAGGGESRAYNLGNGAGYSVREVLDTVGKVAGKAVPAEDAARRDGDPARLVASSDRIKQAWGWTPKTTSLTTIVEDAWRWHQAPRY